MKNKSVVVSEKLFNSHGIEPRKAQDLARRVNWLSYLSGESQELAEAFDLFIQDGCQNIDQFDKFLTDSLLKVMNNPRPTRINMINGIPSIKAAKDFVVNLFPVIKDFKMFTPFAVSENYPQGLRGELDYSRYLDFLIWQQEHGLLDEQEFAQQVEQSVLFILNALSGYCKERQKLFPILLQQATRLANEIERSPYPENYEGNIQRDLAESIKLSQVRITPVDLTRLYNPNSRSDALSHVKKMILANESLLVRLQKVGQDLTRNLEIVKQYKAPERKSVQSGCTRTEWGRGKQSRAFQNAHPELFGISKLTAEGPRMRSLCAQEIVEIRQRSLRFYKPDSTHVLSAQDIHDFKSLLSERDVAKITQTSADLLQCYGDSQKSVLLSAIESLFKGITAQKLRLSEEEYSQQIDHILATIASDFEFKSNGYLAKKLAIVEPYDPNSLSKFYMIERCLYALKDTLLGAFNELEQVQSTSSRLWALISIKNPERFRADFLQLEQCTNMDKILLQLLAMFSNNTITSAKEFAENSIWSCFIKKLHESDNQDLRAINLLLMGTNKELLLHDSLFNQYNFKPRYQLPCTAMLTEQKPIKCQQFYAHYLKELLLHWCQFIKERDCLFNRSYTTISEGF